MKVLLGFRESEERFLNEKCEVVRRGICNEERGENEESELWEVA